MMFICSLFVCSILHTLTTHTHTHTPWSFYGWHEKAELHITRRVFTTDDFFHDMNVCMYVRRVDAAYRLGYAEEAQEGRVTGI